MSLFEKLFYCDFKFTFTEHKKGLNHMIITYNRKENCLNCLK